MQGVQIIKPEWVLHGDAPGAPIYSLDISPDGSRLATGGGDCKVKIWNMNAIRDETIESPKILSASNYHTHTVNCVRWSPCGRYLASCADDRLVLVLHIGAEYSLKVLGEKEANKENWDVYRTYKGHEKDVLHVAWCPKTSRLASCGVDNQILIWQLAEEKLPQTRLRCNGMVKGVAWDPIGKYLAAQGTGAEEKSTNVWRVRDWQMEVKSQKPFRLAPDETMFLRLSWSPDGQSLATTNAFVRQKNACALLARGSGSGDDQHAEWESEASFMGWRKPVTVASFHPKLLKREGKMDACCAIGGCDGSLTLWSANSNGRPLMIVQDLFRKQIFDIAWGGDGYTLSVCSHDGSVAVLVLTDKEIGGLATQQETRAELRKIYGDMDSGMGEHHLPEDAFQLDLEAGAHVHAPVHAQENYVTRDKQEETKTSAGKRRIMPKVLRNPAAADAPPPAGGASVPVATPPVQNSNHAAATTTAAVATAGAGVGAGPAPVPSSAGNAGANPAAGGVHQSAAAALPLPAAAPPLSKEEQQKQKLQAAEMQKQQLAESKKRKAQSQPKSDAGKEKRSAVDKSEKADGGGQASQGHGHGHGMMVVGNLLPPRQPQASQSRQVHAATGPAGAVGKSGPSSLFLNSARATSGWTTVSLTNHEGMSTWSDLLKDPVDAMAGNEKMSVIACADGSVYVYSQSGRRIMPPMLLGSQVSVLEISDAPECFLLAATCAGKLLVWDLSLQQQVCAVELGGFLRDNGAIKTAWVTPTGQPVLAMSNGHCLTVHPGMKTVVRVADDHFTASSLFSQVRAALSSPDVTKGHLARALELSSTSFRSQSVPAMISMDLAQQQDLSLSHAETLVASALVLQSGPEFQHWLHVYVNMLVDQELEPRLREVLELIMPPAASSGASRQSEGRSGRMLLGLSRRELVSRVLQAMGRKRALQRCSAEFNYLLRADGSDGQGGVVANP